MIAVFVEAKISVRIALEPASVVWSLVPLDAAMPLNKIVSVYVTVMQLMM
jgi:hypothetical protein